MINSNSVWYLGLIAASIIVLVVALAAKRKSEVLLLFLVMAGLGYIIEYVIYILLDSYRYVPRILHNEYYDSNMGSLASNLGSLPSMATFVAAFRLRFFWIVLFTAMFVGIEWLFLHLGIYRQNWWRLSYTFAAFPIFFLTAKAWYPRILKPESKLQIFAALLLILFALIATLQFVPIALAESRIYRVDWFGNVSRDTTAMSTLLAYVAGLAFGTAMYVRWKWKWMKFAVPVGLVVLLDFILWLFGIYEWNVWWDPLSRLAVWIFVIWLTSVIHRRLERNQAA